MTKFTIELTGDHVVVSRGVECVVPLDGLTDDMVTKLALHGLVQKIADAASQAAKDLDKGDPAIAVNTAAMMDKARDQIMAGDWTVRGTGSGASEQTIVQRSIMRAAVKVKFGSKSPQWKAFIGLDDAAQIAKLDALFATNAKALEGKVADEMARRKAARDAKAGLAKGLDITL